MDDDNDNSEVPPPLASRIWFSALTSAMALWWKSQSIINDYWAPLSLVLPTANKPRRPGEYQVILPLGRPSQSEVFSFCFVWGRKRVGGCIACHYNITRATSSSQRSIRQRFAGPHWMHLVLLQRWHAPACLLFRVSTRVVLLYSTHGKPLSMCARY